jgi:hypothetical protein
MFVATKFAGMAENSAVPPAFKTLSAAFIQSAASLI